MSINRRKLLKLGVGVGAVAAFPAYKQINWINQDFTRPDYNSNPPVAPEGRKTWRNWSGLHSANPLEIATPPNEAKLADKIASWTGQIRPVGSGHSFTPLVPTEDLIIDISQMSGLYRYDLEAKTATFGAGTRLRQAAILAAKEGLAFINLPDVDVQTLGGSFATGTHGTGRNLTALHDMVLSFRIMTAQGEALNVTRQSNPELFAAGKVSIGSLGVITEYTLQMQSNYALTKTMTLEPTEEVIATMHERSKAHRNFEFLVLPSSGFTVVITNDIYQGELSGRPPSQDDDFLATLKDMRDTLGWWPWLRQKAFSTYTSVFVPSDGPLEQSTAEYWQLLTTSRPSKFNETEFHIPESNAKAAVSEIVKIMDSRKEAYYPIEVRFTGQDDAWLSPFNDGVRCSIAVHTPAEESYKVLKDVIEPVFKKYGGRPHWGKLHSLGQQELTELYPQFEAFKELRQQMDPEGKFLNSHLKKLFGLI